MVGVLCCTNHTPRGCEGGTVAAAMLLSGARWRCGWSFEKSFQVLIAKLWMHHSVDGRVAAQVAKWFWCVPELGPPEFEWVIVTFTIKKWGFIGYGPSLDIPNSTNYQKLIRLHLQRGAGFLSSTWCTQVLQTMAENGLAHHFKTCLPGLEPSVGVYRPQKLGRTEESLQVNDFFASPSGQLAPVGHNGNGSRNAVLLQQKKLICDMGQT